MSRPTATLRRRYVRFTRWRRAHFFRVLEETGHVQMAAEAAGVSLGCIYRLRRTEAGFREKMAAAVEKADARLAMEDQGGTAPAGSGNRCPEALVIRRGIGGRLRVMAAGRRWWTARHDAIFLGWLRATGCVAGSARRTGFTPKTVWNRRDRMPGFARAMDDALEEAQPRLRAKLMETRRDGGPALEPGAWDPPDPVEFDVEEAMWLLKWHDRQRRGY
ncbi:MAG TPA: hypothetical protein VD846_01505 [Allosphingosinicella sp.]|nr:hypothetical protein [Allosphingosinicella sp.]